jgi:hypothetical protein
MADLELDSDMAVDAIVAALPSKNVNVAAFTATGDVTVPDSTVATEALNVQTADARYGDRIWLSAADMNVTNGSPVLGDVLAGRNIGWEFFFNGGEALVAGSVVIPAGWSTYDVNVWWFTEQTVGDVVLRRRVLPKGPGGDGAVGGGAIDVTATVDAVTNTITSTTLASGTVAGTGGSNIFFPQVGRNAADAADTCNGTVYILGLELVRVS